jgi:3-oxoadipate enol-lactonase
VVTWDQRGFGCSSDTRGRAGPEIASRDLAALVDALQLGPCHVVGQSLGGWAALGFALSHPQRVRSVVLADTTAGISSKAIERHFVKSIFPPRELTTGPEPIARHPAFDDTFGRREPARAFLYRELASLCPAPPAETPERMTRTVWNGDDVRRLAAPVLFLVGTGDRTFPPAIVRSAAAQCRNARVVEIEGCGHSPYFERPEVWNAHVLAFLADVEQGRNYARDARRRVPGGTAMKARRRTRKPGC